LLSVATPSAHLQTHELALLANWGQAVRIDPFPQAFAVFR